MANYNIINANNKKLRAFPRIPVREYQLKRRISAKNNFLYELPSYFTRLNSLEYLNLAGNRFIQIPLSLSKLNKLQEINFETNKIEDIGNLVNIESLSVLNLKENLIRRIPNEIGTMKNLVAINLADNLFTSFPDKICQLSKLQKLDLSNNEIQNLPSDIKLLENLTHLNLNNTKLRKFPKEIIGLKKLKELHLDENLFNLPDNYDPLKPYEVIDNLVKQEEFAKLKTTKAFVFKNLSKKIIIDKYNLILNRFTKDKGIDIVNIEKVADINKDTTVVFILVCFDIHDDPQLVYKLIAKCKGLDVNYFILMEEEIIGGQKFVNLIKGAQLHEQRNDLNQQFNITNYNEYDELTNIIFNAVNQRPPNIKFTNIELENIGHFSNISIPIGHNICCLVGENGTGKSTILKAIAIASIGADFESIDKYEIYDLLKIDGLDKDGIRHYSNGNIKLEYTIDGDLFFNEVHILYSKDDGTFSINYIGDFEITTTGLNLKSLILGFPQIRGGRQEQTGRHKKLNQPHVSDILPIINDINTGRLNSFGDWIEQLYFDAIKKEYENKNDIKEWSIIKKVFKIISNFSDYDISFKTVEMGDSSDPSVVWVKTNGVPNGIPLNLISQGLKEVMGWLGYFVQRLIESYPVQTLDQVSNSHAVLIIDEIDSYIHPKWQAKILNILRKEFPNTQFILSTHSPIAISSCNEGEVVLLEIENNEIGLKKIQNTKGWLVENIMHEIMGINNTRDNEVALKINEIEKLFIKKYNGKITNTESKRLNILIESVNNLPQGDPIITLLQLKALGNNRKIRNNAQN